MLLLQTSCATVPEQQAFAAQLRSVERHFPMPLRIGTDWSSQVGLLFPLGSLTTGCRWQ